MEKYLITTVGTSLIGGLKRANIDWQLPVQDISKQILKSENLAAMSAEFSSIDSILKTEKVKGLYIIISDTVEGQKIGELIRLVFEGKFAFVKIRKIAQLNPNNPMTFRDAGLRNLVTTLIQIIKDHRPYVMLNATGGYKAQVSFAGMIGQLFHIPVFYQFEGFMDVIELPALPLQLEQDSWLRHHTLFQKLHEESLLDSVELPEPLAKYVEQYEGYWRLNVVGLCIYEYFVK